MKIAIHIHPTVIIYPLEVAYSIFAGLASFLQWEAYRQEVESLYHNLTALKSKAMGHYFYYNAL